MMLTFFYLFFLLLLREFQCPFADLPALVTVLSVCVNRVSAGPQCLACDDVAQAKDCGRTVVCGDHEVTRDFGMSRGQRQF